MRVNECGLPGLAYAGLTDLIPTSSGLPFHPATDVREHFTAPNGKLVEVLVKGPVGNGTYTRAIKPGETPDDYFPAVVSEAMQAKAHRLVVPKGAYTFHGPKLCTDPKSALQWIGVFPSNTTLRLARLRCLFYAFLPID